MWYSLNALCHIPFNTYSRIPLIHFVVYILSYSFNTFCCIHSVVFFLIHYVVYILSYSLNTLCCIPFKTLYRSPFNTFCRIPFNIFGGIPFNTVSGIPCNSLWYSL
jgi:hypothetical protein